MSTLDALPSAPAEQALDLIRGRLMHQSLSNLLNGVAGARKALPHLAALESAVGLHGPAVVAGLSRVLLVKICSQLNSLPLPADDAPLQDLLDRLMRALEALPERAVGTPQPPLRLQALSDFVTDEKLQVLEVSYADFEAASDQFATTRSGVL